MSGMKTAAKETNQTKRNGEEAANAKEKGHDL